MSPVPPIRTVDLNHAPVRPEGLFVLYWMIAARRTRWNFALDRAVDLAAELNRPLVILEALRSDSPWASDRLHRFVLDGMEDNRRRLEDEPVLYHPYVEPERGAGKGLLTALAGEACAVVTDAFPAFFLPRMTAAAAGRLTVRLEEVDGNGLLPMDDADRTFPTAYAFRQHLQKRLPERIQEMPFEDPLAGASLPRLSELPRELVRRWPPADPRLLQGDPGLLARLPVDHDVPVTGERGGSGRGHELLGSFLDERLPQYTALRNQPEADGTSRLSPFLHFGHVSAHEVVRRVLDREGWSPERLPAKATGSRSGWWGVSEPAEAFLDQVITWRELGFNTCRHLQAYDRYGSLPGWARKTLEDHRSDPRPFLYDPKAFQEGRTHDPLWNAAQGQLLRKGIIHNYLRMLWGKKILEWSASPEQALETMVELNNRYALDGRDPNSYSGIFWVLGRHDRAWGPERPVFGKVRYMTSENTARKVRVKDYIRRYGPPPEDPRPSHT